MDSNGIGWPRRIAGRAAAWWARFWAARAGVGRGGRLAAMFASWFSPPYYGRASLAWLGGRGFVSPSATLHHGDVKLGSKVFIGDRVVIYQDSGGGGVELGDSVHLYGDIYIQTGQGGSVKIGAGTTVQPRCQFSAYKASIVIGCNVQVAPNCAFYPYEHGLAQGALIKDQPLTSKGGIVIGDDVLLGFGVIVLDGVRIGDGAVIGAGSVVTRDIPPGAIAAGCPARVLRWRGAPPRADHGNADWVGSVPLASWREE